jgi:hypothetical protein
VELGFLVYLLMVLVKFMTGSAENERIVMNWRKNAVPLLKNEFSHIGCDSKQQSFALMQRSYALYEYYASGRKNCFYIECKASLKSRHCLTTTLTLDVFNGVQDSVQVLIPIDLKGRELPMEFFMCKKKDLKNKLGQLSHLGEFVKNSQAKNYRLSDEESKDKHAVMVMAEHDEVSNNLIDEECGMVLRKFGQFIHFIHVTDQKVYNGFPLVLKAELSLPSSEADKEANEATSVLLGLLLRLVDNIGSIKYS